MKKLRVAVLFGGQSGEHEVSCASARSVINALDLSKYEVEHLLIAKDGRWIIGQEASQYISDGKEPSADVQESALVPRSDKSEQKYNVVIPLIHGTGGEDGKLQGLLELAKIPYVGSGVLGSAVGMDKIMQKAVLSNAGIPVTKAVSFTSYQYDNETQRINDDIDQLGYPVFVKPANSGSSVGISKVSDSTGLQKAIKAAIRFDSRILVELSVPAARELEIAILGNNEIKASVIGEVVPSGEFYDYEAKYVDGLSDLVIPAKIESDTEQQIKQLATQAFQVLDLRGMARVDFLLSKTSGELFLNEVNTIPGFTQISMYPKLWEASGIKYTQLLDELIELAIKEFQERQNISHNYSTNDWWTES